MGKDSLEEARDFSNGFSGNHSGRSAKTNQLTLGSGELTEKDRG